MCGIVGYTGKRSALPVLIQGLEQLEYRGYDSAGVACLDASGRFFIAKEKGKLSELKSALRVKSVAAHQGIGHTRWATHGEPSKQNAHPHLDSHGKVVLVHNGIIENYAEIRKQLVKKKVRFLSQTDTESATQLIGDWYRKLKNPLRAFREAILRMHGYFAFVTLFKDDPEAVYVFKRSNPLVIGLGDGENFIASDVTALLAYTRKVIFLEDDDLAVVRPEGVAIYNLKTGKSVDRKQTIVNWDFTQARKQGYPHFMLKEIYEQPQALAEILSKILGVKDEIAFETLSSAALNRLKKIKKISIVSCGTAHHAGLVGSVMLEAWARVPCRVQVSSEFRYGDPIVGKDDLIVLITQSGETADTLAALREAKSKGAMTLAIVNVVGSTVSREADAVIYTHAGPEIGVASTKAYTAQLLTLSLFSILMGRLRGKISSAEYTKLIHEVKKIPAASVRVLKQAKALQKCAKLHYKRKNFLYLGRGANYPTALEGALKLKEISYAHAHGYAAGEMKHGPIALIDNQQVVICIAPASATYEKTVSNIQEIRARKGIVICIGTEGDRFLEKISQDFFTTPKIHELLSPILTVLPLQFFAYYVSVLNGRDVDQPRNLAKSVTVE
ncbi:MAG TPA: glutamine--fructose-6-phosphate transaminase (isomerizing) [Candidatus Omnitrophota bacterium]|nr:glutamine--fructose-6-phosphate transaminase (isomerizing) [Candidatus Omnitrophota bacterium]